MGRGTYICHCSLPFSVLGLEIPNSLSTALPLWEPVENLSFGLEAAWANHPVQKDASLSTEIVATSTAGQKKMPEIKSYLLQMLLTKKIICPLLLPLLSNDLANLEK